MSRGEKRGYLCLVLHAHLPYIRHPEHEFFLEENWFFEAVTETYIPLLETFSRLVNEGADFRVTLSLSPTLLEMFNDPLLRERCSRHIERLIDLSEREVSRTRKDIHFGPVARMYLEKFRDAHDMFQNVFRKDLSSAFRELQDSGRVQIITTAATHAFLPSMSGLPKAVRAQIRRGVLNYAKAFGRRPAGMWLPECGFAPGFDRHLEAEGLSFFFLDSHGIDRGMPSPVCGVYEPVVCPSGVVAFGRDPETSEQVWSSAVGYPGDPSYRDFYRDIGFDLDADYLMSYLKPFGARTFTGLKYHRITGGSGAKGPYVKKHADKKAAEHAEHFIRLRDKQVRRIAGTYRITPVINAIYDAELFGHWWFEGPRWLYNVLRGIHDGRGEVTTITPGEYIDKTSLDGKEPQGCEPSLSSWGERGYSEVWLNESNDYTCRHILKTAERMIRLAESFPNAEGLLKRALNQAAREVLLAQHSDWPFIINAGTSKEYAEKRFEEHIGRFSFLRRCILDNSIPEDWLTEIEEKDKIFGDIDYLDFNQP